MRLLLVELLVVVVLYSSCHDFHVIMAVEWKTRWKSTQEKNHHRRRDCGSASSFLLLPASRWFEEMAIYRERRR
jgi:hypothetical protein